TSTSCAYFFNDLSGIEPRQNITYAIDAAMALSKYSNANLLETLYSNLGKAKSNIKAEGNGMTIAQRDLPMVPSHCSAAAYFTLKEMYCPSKTNEQWGFYTLLSLTKENSLTKISLRNNRTLETYNLQCAVSKDGEGLYEFTVSDYLVAGKWIVHLNDIGSSSLSTIKRLSQSKLLEDLSDNTLWNIENHTAIGMAYESKGFLLTALKALVLGPKEILDTETDNLKRISDLVSKLLSIDSTGKLKKEITDLFTHKLYTSAFIGAYNGITSELKNEVLALLKIVYNNNLKPHLTDIQNILYHTLEPTEELYLYLNFEKEQ
ncbi:MAG: DUF3536 domain-containing protein, partial [Sphaerochaetaceae bacterium]|nr:DUF3536 domain-containing protein [Sphaerochaetaceae bacterium]